MKAISKLILKVFGWKFIVTIPEPPKSIICVAPHTSNWDFIIGQIFKIATGRKVHFLMKKSWFFFPFNYLFGTIGGIAIDRSKSNSVTEQMAVKFLEQHTFHLAITPEGTRSLTERWKLGFYYIAVKANVPIQLGYIDYDKKEMGITGILYPSGNETKDLTEIYNFYKGIKGLYPDKFYNPAEANRN